MSSKVSKDFYTCDEACKYLGIDEQKLASTMDHLQMRMRSWPKIKGEVILQRDVETIKKYLEHPARYS